MSELSNGKGDELYVFKNIDVDSSALEGLVICFTGKFSRFNIEEAITIVELAGGEISNSINSSINIVVAGKNSANELEKAEKRESSPWAKYNVFRRYKKQLYQLYTF